MRAAPLLLLVLVISSCEGRSGDVLVARPGPTAAACGEPQALHVLDARGRMALLRTDGARIVDVRADALALDEAGALACVPRRSCGERPASPQSMAIDGDGRAWIAYCSGELFRADLRTGACDPAAVSLEGTGLERLTLAMVRDTLFIAGGPAMLPNRAVPPSGTLGALRAPGLDFERIGGLAGWPALAPTPEGELWAYFPPSRAGLPRIAQIDLQTGGELRALPNTPPSHGPDPVPFVAWGEDFWMFLSQPGTPDATTLVHRVSRTTGGVLGTSFIMRRAIAAAAVAPCGRP